MTDRHARLIVGIPNLTSHQCAVLVWLALHANENGYAWPGMTLLEQETRLKKRRLYYLLSELETLKVIARSKGTPKTHYRTVYFMAYAQQDPVTQPLPAKSRKAAPTVNPPGFFESILEEKKKEKQHNGSKRA